jgi:hypothetical protein
LSVLWDSRQDISGMTVFDNIVSFLIDLHKHVPFYVC